MQKKEDLSVIDPMVVKKVGYLKEFVDSEGWRLIKDEIQKQIYEHTIAFASKTEMSIHEIDYRRGALLTLNGFLTYPDKLLESLENQLPLNE